MFLLQYKRAQWLEPEVNCTLVSVLLAFAELKEHFWYCSELAIRQILVFYVTKNRCSICELVFKSFAYITLSIVLVSGYHNLIAGLLHTSQLHEALEQKKRTACNVLLTFIAGENCDAGKLEDAFTRSQCVAQPHLTIIPCTNSWNIVTRMHYCANFIITKRVEISVLCMQIWDTEGHRNRLIRPWRRGFPHAILSLSTLKEEYFSRCKEYSWRKIYIHMHTNYTWNRDKV